MKKETENKIVEILSKDLNRSINKLNQKIKLLLYGFLLFLVLNALTTFFTLNKIEYVKSAEEFDGNLIFLVCLNAIFIAFTVGFLSNYLYAKKIKKILEEKK